MNPIKPNPPCENCNKRTAECHRAGNCIKHDVYQHRLKEFKEQVRPTVIYNREKTASNFDRARRLWKKGKNQK